MKTITILSGKGGVGKSSITASLAVLLAKKHKIVSVDCDVDAPNLALVFGIKKFETQERLQTSEKAELIKDKCNGCKECLKVCNFNAIKWVNNKPIFNKFLCEGCGVCQLVCKQNAIKLKKVENGRINIGKTKYNFKIISGQLEMGESGSGKIIAAVKNKAQLIAKKEKANIILIDSAAGIGCPVIASITGSDYVIAITEPTPSALSDMKRALKVVEHFNIPYGIIINKYNLNEKFSKKIENFANNKLLDKIPYDKSFVDALVNLTPIVVYNPRYTNLFNKILDKIKLS